MTGQARVLIRNYGTDIRLECLPCGINSPSYWPGATIRTALRAGDER